jgi:hypothetical protein
MENVARRHGIAGLRMAVERPTLAWTADLPRGMATAALGAMAWYSRRQLGARRHGPQSWGYFERGRLDEIRILEISGPDGSGQPRNHLPARFGSGHARTARGCRAAKSPPSPPPACAKPSPAATSSSAAGRICSESVERLSRLCRANRADRIISIGHGAAGRSTLDAELLRPLLAQLRAGAPPRLPPPHRRAGTGVGQALRHWTRHPGGRLRDGIAAGRSRARRAVGHRARPLARHADPRAGPRPARRARIAHHPAAARCLGGSRVQHEGAGPRAAHPRSHRGDWPA